MRYFQQIAREDLERFGMSYEFLRDNNIVFVLSKYKIKVYDTIPSETYYTLRTSPCEVKGVSFIRDFVLIDSNGKCVAEASSSWVIINFLTRRILRPTQLPKEVIPDDKLVGFAPEKILIDGDINFYYNVKVMHSLLDENNHLNNCNYMDIIFDGLYENNIEASQIANVDISFEHEALFDDMLRAEYSVTDDNISVKCYNLTQDNICFNAVILPLSPTI